MFIVDTLPGGTEKIKKLKVKVIRLLLAFFA